MYISIEICKIILLVINLLICIDMYIVIKASNDDVRLIGLYVMSVIGLVHSIIV